MGEHANRGSHALRIALPNARCQEEVHLFAAIGIKAPHLIGFEGGSSPERPPYGLMTTHRSNLVVRRESGCPLAVVLPASFCPTAHLGNPLRDSLVVEGVSFQAHRLHFNPLRTQTYSRTLR